MSSGRGDSRTLIQNSRSICACVSALGPAAGCPGAAGRAVDALNRKSPLSDDESQGHGNVWAKVDRRRATGPVRLSAFCGSHGEHHGPSGSDADGYAGKRDEAVAAFPDVEIGSYPHLDTPDHRVKITLDGRDRAAVDAATEHLVRRLGDIVVRTE